MKPLGYATKIVIKFVGSMSYDRIGRVCKTLVLPQEGFCNNLSSLDQLIRRESSFSEAGSLNPCFLYFPRVGSR